jgi:hypothetical protein
VITHNYTEGGAITRKEDATFSFILRKHVAAAILDASHEVEEEVSW